MTHHFAMTSSLLIKILKIDKFDVFSSDIDVKTKMDIFRDYISLIIYQCHLQATEGSLRWTQSVRQPRSASKRSALVTINHDWSIRYNELIAFKMQNMLGKGFVDKLDKFLLSIVENRKVKSLTLKTFVL